MEGHTFGPDISQQSTTNRGLNQVDFVTYVTVLRNNGLFDTHLKTRVNDNHLIYIVAMNYGDIL